MWVSECVMAAEGARLPSATCRRLAHMDGPSRWPLVLPLAALVTCVEKPLL